MPKPKIRADWYAEALGVLEPLRYQMHILLETEEDGMLRPTKKQLREAKKALQQAENFFAANIFKANEASE